MKIFDISQAVPDCSVYPGDSSPVLKSVASIDKGDICNLTEFSMCAHNGTHIDAPYHFFSQGKTVAEISPDYFAGKCFVCFFDGELSSEDAQRILDKACKTDRDAAKRILIGGKAVVTLEAAAVFRSAHIYLIGNESQTVGPEDAPAKVHYELLGSDIVLLEGIRLGGVPEGVYFLSAAPLNLGRCDGAPCRALLISE